MRSMRLETHILTRLDEASVPAALVERIARFLEGIVRIDVLVREGKRWVKVNAVWLDRPATPDDVMALATRVKACADDHAEETGHGGKFRALMRRKLGPEKDRRTYTFDVETRAEQRWRERMGPYEGKVMATPDEASMRFLETVVLHHMAIIDCVIREHRRRQANAGRVMEQLGQLMAMYRQGLQMAEEAERELAEARMQQVLATMKAKSSAAMWEALGPVVETLVASVRQSVFGPDCGDADGEDGVEPDTATATGETAEAEDDLRTEDSDEAPLARATYGPAAVPTHEAAPPRSG